MFRIKSNELPIMIRSIYFEQVSIQSSGSHTVFHIIIHQHNLDII
jgi:hypothetical protein